MLVALFIGDHSQDDLLTRLGWWVTRMGQKGEYAQVTHCEAILEEFTDGSVNIGSCSLRDGGVRVKRAKLNPEHWLIVKVSANKTAARKWFAEHAGEKYDIRGAFATAFPIQMKQANRWFCNEAVGRAIGVNSPEIFGPSQFASLVMTMGEDVTETFFRERA